MARLSIFITLAILGNNIHGLGVEGKKNIILKVCAARNRFVYISRNLEKRAKIQNNNWIISENCVPLPQCKTLLWMWRHRHEIPDVPVEKFVRSLRCGLEICPKERKILSEERNPLVQGYRRNPVKKPTFNDKVDYKCEPFLK